MRMTAAGWRAAALVAGSWLMIAPAWADDAITVTLQNHQFSPAEIHVPAKRTVTLVIDNKDPQAEEFESSVLKVEKVIAGGKQGTVRLHPMDPGRYPFIGEYHQDTAHGVLVAE